MRPPALASAPLRALAARWPCTAAKVPAVLSMLLAAMLTFCVAAMRPWRLSSAWATSTCTCLPITWPRWFSSVAPVTCKVPAAASRPCWLLSTVPLALTVRLAPGLASPPAACTRPPWLSRWPTVSVVWPLLLIEPPVLSSCWVARIAVACVPVCTRVPPRWLSVCVSMSRRVATVVARSSTACVALSCSVPLLATRPAAPFNCAAVSASVPVPACSMRPCWLLVPMPLSTPFSRRVALICTCWPLLVKRPPRLSKRPVSATTVSAVPLWMIWPPVLKRSAARSATWPPSSVPPSLRSAWPGWAVAFRLSRPVLTSWALRVTMSPLVAVRLSDAALARLLEASMLAACRLALPAARCWPWVLRVWLAATLRLPGCAAPVARLPSWRRPAAKTLLPVACTDCACTLVWPSAAMRPLCWMAPVAATIVSQEPRRTYFWKNMQGMTCRPCILHSLALSHCG